MILKSGVNSEGVIDNESKVGLCDEVIMHKMRRRGGGE